MRPADVHLTRLQAAEADIERNEIARRLDVRIWPTEIVENAP